MRILRVFGVFLFWAVAAFVGCTEPQDGNGLPNSYILRVERALELCRADIPAMIPVVDRAAALLAADGRFWAAGQPGMVSEVTGRAGGFIFLKNLRESSQVEANDVVLYFSENSEPVPDSLMASGAYTIAFGGRRIDAGDSPWFDNHAEEARISPTLANTIPAWVFTGELIAALTRLGEMPVLSESIGIYSGALRNARFKNEGLFFHEREDVSPVSPGVIGGAWLDTIGAILRRVETQERAKLNEAGVWCAEAKKRGKRLAMYSMGHLFPDEVANTAIGALFESAVWNAGFRNFVPLEMNYAEGDVFVHIGYQHPPSNLLQPARAAGARVVYISVLENRDFKRDPRVLWIDPKWPWVDACVPLNAYDLPMLASSGIVNGAIAWEIHRVTERELAAGSSR